MEDDPKDPLSLATEHPVNFYADLDCQVCGMFVDGGFHDGERLTWVCQNGHESKIDKFRIG